MRIGLLSLAAALAVAVSGCNIDGAEAPYSPEGPVSPQEGAHLEAQWILQHLRVPANSVPVDSDPTSVLSKPPQRTATDDLVDLHKWWTTSLSPAATLDWLQRHAWPGHHADGQGSYSGPGQPTADYLMFPRKPPPDMGSETLLLTVAPVDGGSAIRADAQVVWRPRRSVDELIPSDLDRISVSAYKLDSRIGRHVLSGAKARRLAKVINAMPTAVRARHSCFADRGYRVNVVAGPLTFDEDIACFTGVVSDAGRTLPALAPSRAFVRAVTSAMGLPTNFDR